MFVKCSLKGIDNVWDGHENNCFYGIENDMQRRKGGMNKHISFLKRLAGMLEDQMD